ncbi:MAG: prepilin-type N-terminal cleavage/methylation domain-containing protein [bacterium]|nr:MAG: prepilin-type N-terminal cleavage/methylation domain-containing protein [bacterium]
MFKFLWKDHPDGESAFTLIEVMTAVTILAIMATVAFTVVFGAVKRSRHIDRRVELSTEAASIVSLMVDDVRGAFRRQGVVPVFEGTDGFNAEDPADSISFLTTAILPVNPELPAGGVGEVEYSVMEGESGKLLLLRREQNPAEAPYDEGGVSIEVTDRLKSLDITYSDGEDWFDNWDTESAAEHEAGKLPRQVRVELVLENGDLTVTHHGSVAPVMAVGR